MWVDVGTTVKKLLPMLFRFSAYAVVVGCGERFKGSETKAYLRERILGGEAYFN